MAAANMIRPLAKWSKFPSNNLINIFDSHSTYRYFAQYHIVGSTFGFHSGNPNMEFVSRLIKKLV